MKKSYTILIIMLFGFLGSIYFFKIRAYTALKIVFAKPEPQEQKEGTEVQKIPVVKVLTGNFTGSDFDNEARRIIEEKTKVKLNVSWAPWGEDYRTKQIVMLASNDIPDIMIIDNNALEIKYAAEQKLLPLNQYFEKYPNIKASRNQDVWNFMEHEDGNIYAVPTVCYFKDDAILTFRALLYRQDWLRKFNMKIPETLEEYYKFSDFVSNQDPDGNGKKDTYAISGNKDIAIRNTFDHIFGAYGVLPNYWFVKNGTVVNGSVEPEAKEALKLLNIMYSEGMIDPEFITDDQDRQKSKFMKGMYGATVFFAHSLDKNNMESYYEDFKKNNLQGELVIGKTLSVKGYDSIGFRTLSRRGWMRTAVMSQSKVADAALRVLDFSCSEEGSMLSNFGRINEDYIIKDGTVITKTNLDIQKKVGINLYHIPIVRTELWPLTTEQYARTLVDWSRSTTPNIADELLLPELAEFENQLNSYTDEQFCKMIMGIIPIEEGFDRFVKEWKARGGETVLKALNKSYENRIKNK
jgi:putative aldouronate transport system substrate-binding protein